MKLSVLFITSVALSMIFPALHAQENPLKPLSAYRGTNRVLLVFTPTENDSSYQEQLKLWRNEKAGFEDRQLVVLPVPAAGKPSTSDATGTLAKRYRIDAATFKVVLIGKDGHAAFQSAETVTGDALYRRIDAMPMRREEMDRQKAKK